ncbi:hemocytin-like isoform X2 [Haemaphysalis longicornis]
MKTSRPGFRPWLAAFFVGLVFVQKGEASYGIKTKQYDPGFKSPIAAGIKAARNSSGEWCEVPPNPNAASSSCQRKPNSMQCTANCMTGFQFPDGTRHLTLHCDMASKQWTPLRQFPDCEGVCQPPCLHGGKCYGNNRCVCSNQYRGDHCQYPITLCDGHILGAGGSSWHCNHTHVETLCRVSCPSGFVFQPPGAAEVYRCSLQGRWDPPFVPPCVPDYLGAHASNLSHGHYHQGQQTITEVGEHGGQQTIDGVDEHGHDQHSGHGGGDTGQRDTSSESLTDKGSDLPPPEVPGEQEPPPPSTGVCSTWGQFQFKSFDGTLFRFAGSCTYVLLKDCAQPGSSSQFAIELEHSPGCPGSFNCSRTLHLVGSGPGERLSLPLGHPPPDEAQPLVTAIPGLSAQHAGKYLVLQSPQGYTVWIDEDSVQIRVTPALRETACGLCGHFDGDPSNDIAVLDARSALTPRDFGIAWAVERDCIHSGLEREACTIQSSADKTVSLKSFERCSIIFNEIYRECHNVLRPNRFFEACKQDCCDKRSPDGCECATLDEYFRECQRLGVSMKESWRRDTVCPHTCSGGTEYRECGPSCRATCANREPACTVSQCASGCFCPEGTLWHRGRCVRPQQCGCSYRGRDYGPGERIDQDCNTCVCEDGSWQCTAAICEASCSVLLGGIYSTFDGRRFQTRAHCGFILLQAEGIRVIQNRRTCVGLPKDAVCLGDVHLQLGEGVLISVNQELQVLINGRVLNSLPAVLPNVTITRPTSFFIEVQTPGLTLLTDGKSRLVLTATEGLYTKTMGLCGTFNHNTQDDFLCPGGDVNNQVELFAQQWADGECASVESVNQLCGEAASLWEESKHACRQLYQGAFAECHRSVNPDPFFELCIQASCSCHSDSGNCLCPVFSHYAYLCAGKGHAVDWRPQVPACGVFCEGGQQYQSCASVCDSSCALIGRNTSCDSRCVEGCACEPGFSMDRRGHCVPVSQCGCFFAGHEYPTGFKQRRHDQYCECLAGQWQCRPASADEVILVPPAGECGTNEEFTECRSNCPATCATLHSPLPTAGCAVDVCQAGCQCRRGFVRDERTGTCVQPTSCPCQHGVRSYADGDKIHIECNDCVCERGRWLCTQYDCAGTCALWGDSHVRTFDGVAFDFRGTCDYVLAKGRLSGKESVSVVVQNVPCGSKSSCAKTVTIVAGSEEPLVLTEGHPVPPVREGSGLSVRTLGLFVAVHVHGSLSVYWDKHTRVYVVAGPSWAGKLSGLCGNFNGDATDEFLAPSGGPTLPQAEEFVDAWRLHSYCPLAQPSLHGCLQRPERRQWASTRCAALKEHPFRECHSEVDVQPYYERCVSDTCACDTGGDCECLCTALAAYAHECAQRGVRVLWRSQELCPVQCATCDEYSACVSGCEPPNCAHPTSEANCPEAAPVCLEGCAPARCPVGHVHRNATDHHCVPYADCEEPPETGCNIGGVLYKEGQRVATPNPCQSCFCNSGKIDCIGRPCPIELATCAKSGWSEWYSMSNPQFQRGNDFEILLAHADRCPLDNMVRVECRTVNSHVPWNETGEALLCSAETGLRCLKEDQDDGPCSDYEMRVYCQCAQIQETTTFPVPTTVKLVGPYCDAWTPWINQDSPADDGGDNELLENIPGFSDMCPELTAVECLPSDPEHSTNVEEEIAKLAEPCNRKGLLCSPGSPCIDYKVRAYCTCPSTPIPTMPPPIISRCPPDMWVSECGIRCNATCDHFLHKLRAQGYCHDEDGCVDGCFRTVCEPGSVHLNPDNCVPPQHCPCAFPGREAPLAPGEVVELECEKCQCANNRVSCASIPGCGTTTSVTTGPSTPIPTMPPPIISRCPPDMWVSECGIRCNATCDHFLHKLRAQGYCHDEDGCVDGCFRTVCEPGSVHFNPDNCVPPQHCPCAFPGREAPLAPGEVVELECEKCQCANNRVSCASIPGCGTTTSVTTVTPVPTTVWSPSPEGGCWTEWLNEDVPEGPGDFEDMRTLQAQGKVCMQPAAIECRVEADKTHWTQTGQKVQCSMEQGLQCWNSDNGPQGCLDYQVRFYCPCEEYVQTTTAEVPRECRQGWSPWINGHLLDRRGDEESLQSARESGLLECPTPTSMECREADTKLPWDQSGLIGVRCDLSAGLRCRSSSQAKGRGCVDFEVRFYCDCGVSEPTSYPPRVSVVPTTLPSSTVVFVTTPAPCAYWSDWIDASRPGANGHYGDHEAGVQQQPQLKGFCQQGIVTTAECRSEADVYYSETGQVGLTCSVEDGFNCADVDQPNGQSCYNYKIRFFCSCEEATTTPLVIVPAKPTPHPSCSYFVRVVDGPVPLRDSSFKASSSRDTSTGPQAARLRSVGSWVPNPGSDEFIEVDIGKVVPLYGIETKGDPGRGAWVTSFVLLYSQDGVAYSQLSNPDGSPKALGGNHDARSLHLQYFEEPLEARFVRIQPRTWVSEPALKFELFACAIETSSPGPTLKPGSMSICQEPMGLESGLLGEERLHASSDRDEQHDANEGRLGGQGWVAGVADKHQYLQVDFGEIRNITAVVTQGRPVASQWVTSYMVQYSNNAHRWSTIKDANGDDLVFPGNFDASTQVTRVFPKPVSARYLRIVPVTWNNWIALQLEVLGCEPPGIEERTTTQSPPPPVVVEEKFRCPEPNGLFPDAQNCRRFYHCSNDEPHHKWCPGDLHFNPKLLVCDWPQNAGCEQEGGRLLDVTTVPAPTEEEELPCVAFGPWVSTSEPTPESGGDVEDVARVVAESGVCLYPLGIECREYATDADYRKTGQRVICDVERGLRCVDSEQPGGEPCLNYKVRVKCWTCAPLISTTTESPTVPPVIPCPEVSVTDNATFCPVGCPEGYACDGERCVPAADCPCVRDGSLFPVGGMLETRTCHECQCNLGGRSSCLPKACPPCPEGRSKTLGPSCTCDCGSCPTGLRLCPTSGECISEQLWCDGIVNCPDDETDCEVPTTPARCPPLVKKFCAKGQTLVLIKDDLDCDQYTCESGVPPPATQPPPIVEHTCELVGHHFKTFDDREFDYSFCNHVLVSDAANGSITILVQRNCAVEDEVACPKRVFIKQLGHRISLGTDLTVHVDDFEYSPAQLPLLAKRIPEFEIEIVGEQLYFRSRIEELVLRLDIRGRVHVEVDSSLKGALAGLCGFFNGVPNDDFTTPSGGLAASVSDFGDAWATPGSEQECKPLGCPKEMLIAAATICNRLREEPLSACPGLDAQLSNCLSATCECLQRNASSDASCACEAYLDAVTQCEIEDRDERLQGWRLKYGCVPDCPPEMQWLDCGPDCQLTCAHFLNGEVGCATKTSCNPGCFCPPGTVLDGEICKSPDECADKVCTGYGDPTIETFDGWKFQLQSSGHFDLVSDTEGRFTVDGVTGKCEERLTCILGLNVKHKHHMASIRRNEPAVIDGKVYEASDLPWKGDGLTVFVMPGKVTVVLFQDLGVQVRYNEISAAFSIHVPSKSFFNRTAGLCGNCNGQPDDDIKNKDGTISDDIVDFICSWETQLSHDECVMNFTGVEPTAPPPPGACTEMLDRSVFGECPNLIDVSKYLDQCLHDTALTVKENSATCASLVEYAHACCRAGVHVDDLYIQRFCNISCPGDTVYMSCHDGCPQSCDANHHQQAADASSKGAVSAKGHYHTADCRKLLVDGCFCPHGLVFVDGRCQSREVCDLCDEEGHKVGDEWKPDSCTSCTCKKGGHADCQHEVCPPDPVCREDQKLVRLGEAHQCCEERHCQDVVEKCPEVILPKCQKGDVAKTRTDEKGCPVYFCECDPALCPPVVWPTDLEIGQEVEMTPVGCCASLQAVCYPDKCPPQPQCPPGTELVATPGACCSNYKCKAPEGVCLFTHQFEVNEDGREVPLELHRQNISFYKADSVWNDGLCRNCSCDGSGSQFMARCTHETCYESSELPDDKDYYLAVVDVPHRCCPSIVRLFCKDEYGDVREPGDVWQSRVNPCQSHVCERTTAGEVHKVLRSIVCSKCPEDSQEMPPAPGECCPRCQVVACDEAGTLHAVGTRWNSTTHQCYEASCVQHGDSVRTVYNSPSCAPVPKRCPKDQVVWDDRHCCQKCNVTTVSDEVCSPARLKPEDTVKMLSFHHQKWGVCVNTEAVQDAMECAGNCESHSYFASGGSGEVSADCKCCSPVRWTSKKIELTCPNGRKIANSFKQPTECKCTPCVPHEREREENPSGEQGSIGVKVPFKDNTIYTTLQRDQPMLNEPEKKWNVSGEEKPYNPGYGTHVQEPNVPVPEPKPGNQVTQEQYKPDDDPAHELANPLGPIAQEPFRPEDVPEKPPRPEPISQVVQEPYTPDDVPEPNSFNPLGPIAQEPFRPDDVTEKSPRPEPMSQVVQEPYRPDDVPEPNPFNPLGPIAQEPFRPDDVTEKPPRPEPLSQVVQEPYRPDDVPEPNPFNPLGPIAQEPFRPEDATEKPPRPEPLSQVVQEPYRPDDAHEPNPFNPLGPIAQEPFRPEDVTEKPPRPEPMSQVVQEPYKPDDVSEPNPFNPLGPIAQEPFRPEDATEKPPRPEPLSQVVQEPYRPDDAHEPNPFNPLGPIAQEPFRPEDVTEKPPRPEPMSQVVQEPYKPDDVPEPNPFNPLGPIAQEPFRPEDVTEKPPRPEPMSQVVQEPYRPDDVPEPNLFNPLGPIAQEPFRPEDVTEKSPRPEPLSQVAQETYRPDDVLEPNPPNPVDPIGQKPFGREDLTEQLGPISQKPYNPEDDAEHNAFRPSGPIAQEPYRPEDTVPPKPPTLVGPIVQEPYRPEDSEPVGHNDGQTSQNSRGVPDQSSHVLNHGRGEGVGQLERHSDDGVMSHLFGPSYAAQQPYRPEDEEAAF